VLFSDHFTTNLAFSLLVKELVEALAKLKVKWLCTYVPSVTCTEESKMQNLSHKALFLTAGHVLCYWTTGVHCIMMNVSVLLVSTLHVCR